MIRAISLLLTLALAGTASAQGTPPGQFEPYARGTDRLTATEQMAQCLVRRDRAASANYALAIGAEADRAAWKRLAPAATACVRSHSLTMQGAELQGALSEALLKADGGVMLNRAVTQTPVPPVRMARITNPEYPTGLMSCVAAADPVGAVAMLRSAPATPEEVSRFQALAPALQACVPAQGEVHLKPARIRFLLATAMFRRVSQQEAAR